MSSIKTLKSTPTCFDDYKIIIRGFLHSLPKSLNQNVFMCGDAAV
jgi:hypothetical protein